MKLLTVGVLLALSFSVFAEMKPAPQAVNKAEAKVVEKKAQVNCPIMGTPINKKIYVDYKGKRIYFCCPVCPAEFKKNPDAIIKKMEAEGIILEDSPKK